MIDVHVDSDLIFKDLTDKVCVQALGKLLKGVTFTHSIIINSLQDSTEYFAKIKTIPDILYKYKLFYQGQVNLFNGVEFFIDFNRMEEVLKIIHIYEFDYIVASLVPISINTHVNYEKYLQNLQRYSQYFNAFSKIEDIVDWCYLSGDEGVQKERLSLLDLILQVLISNYKCLELDSSVENISPQLLHTLQRYKELGGSLISLGSNSKKTLDVGQGFQNFRLNLIELGFNFTTHYSKKNPIHDSLITQ